DNSNFVLRWEIDNAAETLASRNADSKVFNEGGFEWIAGFRPSAADVNDAHLILTCNNPRGEKWRCEADVDFVYCKTDGSSVRYVSRLSFSDGERVYTRPNSIGTTIVANPDNGYITNGKVIFEFHINIISSECIEPTSTFDLTKICSPNELINVYLVIGDKKLRVSK
ncbi:hypothetical protein PENTCL1PPCAC_23868, partial [Pristionchus entomophagus]